jgi:hypothetical protein
MKGEEGQVFLPNTLWRHLQAPSYSLKTIKKYSTAFLIVYKFPSVLWP